jgi:hypothetical protein
VNVKYGDETTEREAVVDPLQEWRTRLVSAYPGMDDAGLPLPVSEGPSSCVPQPRRGLLNAPANRV